MKMSKKTQQSSVRKGIRINITLKLGSEPVNWLLEWKKRGLVTSNRDAVVQAFRSFREKILEQDLRAAQLISLKRGVGCDDS